MSKKININDYTYNLPNEKIALYPLQERDQSKLLVYQKGKIEQHQFQSIVDFLPSNSILFFNDTKVIPARLHFQKDTGASIELFLLNPILPSVVLAEAMQATQTCTWKCTIGNLKRWSAEILLTKEINGITLSAKLVDKEQGTVEFSWNTSASFVAIITQSGETPLPPYIKRKAEASDKDRYQTIYSHYEGAVAAPTAGLHFTDRIFKQLEAKGIEKDFVTLHVSAGTFQPVKVENALEHPMHKEQIIIRKTNVQNLLQKNKFIAPVGTTSMRTLESMYWFGVKLLNDDVNELSISQTYPYENRTTLPTREEALHAILKELELQNTDQLTGDSSIFIHPGYSFKMCDALVTNFHQPGSTLILLVAAFIGDDWKLVYKEALENDFRFLSYGDSSLLIP